MIRFLANLVFLLFMSVSVAVFAAQKSGFKQKTSVRQKPSIKLLMAKQLLVEGGESDAAQVAGGQSVDAPPASGHDAAEESLVYYINGALDSHPSIAVDSSKARAAKSEIGIAEAGNRLKVSAGASVNANSNSTVGLSRITPTVTAKLPLYNAGRVEDEIESKTSLYDSAKAKVRTTCEDVAKRTLDLYQTALIEQSSVEVLKGQVEALNKLRLKVQGISEIDKGRASELWQVTSRLGLVKAQLDARTVSLATAKSQLANYSNLNVGQLKLVELSTPAIKREDYTSILSEHPKVISAKYESASQAAIARIASKWNKPDIALELQASANVGQVLASEDRVGLYVNLNGNLDMVDGGAGNAKATAEAARQQAAQASIDALIYDLSVSLDNEVLLNQQKHLRLPALEMQVQNADKIRSAGWEQFNVGRRTLLELTTFENDFFTALLELRQEEINMAMGSARVLSAAGALTRDAALNNSRCAL